MATRDVAPPSTAATGLVLGLLGLVLPLAAVIGLVVSLIARRTSRERRVRIAVAVSTATTVMWVAVIAGAVALGVGDRLTAAFPPIGMGEERESATTDPRITIGDVMVGDCLARQNVDADLPARLVPCDTPRARLVVTVERVDLTGIDVGDDEAESARLTERCEDRVGALAADTSGLRPRTESWGGWVMWYAVMVCTVEAVDGGPPPVDLVALTDVFHGQRPGVTSPDS